MSKRFTFITLITIIIIATALRIWNISNNPSGFFVDEASHGLEAYSILKTGKDTHDKPFPIIFQAAGDYRDPVMIYSTIPFVALFGLNEFSVRLVSALYGVAAVAMMYFVGKEYFNVKIGLWAALLLAISPWHVHFSRVGFQLISSVFWMLFAIYFLKKSLKHITYLVFAFSGLIIAFFTYSPVKMYIPFILLFHMFCYPKEWFLMLKNKYFWIISILMLIILTALLYEPVKEGTLFKRWNQVEKKMTLVQVGIAYLNHFSPEFLFISGDSQFPGQDVQRHSIHGVGELYWFQIPFLFIALSAFIASKKERMKLLFFVLFLYIYPIGSIFTAIQPHATRSILGVIPFTFLTAYGIEETLQLFKKDIFKRLFYMSFGTTIVVSIFLFVIALRNYPLQSADYYGWQYGYREAMAYLKQQEAHYDHLYVTHRFNMGMELLDFYNYEYNCEKCKVMPNPIKITENTKELFVLRPEDIKEAAELYPNFDFIKEHSIRLPNGKEELSIGRFEPIDSSS